MKRIQRKLFRAKISFFDTLFSEWKALRKDTAVVSTLIGLSLLLLFVYTYIYSNEVVREIPVAVINQDASATSRDYEDMLELNEAVEVQKDFQNLQAAKNAFYAGDVKAIVLIPKSFQKNLRAGRPTAVKLYADASNMIFYKQVVGALNLTNTYFNTGVKLKREKAMGASESSALAKLVPVQLVSRSVFNSSAGYATYLIPTVTALVLQLVILMSIGILGGSRREANELRKSFPRLLHTGGAIPIVLGKAVLYSFIFAVIIPLQVGIIYSFFSIPVRSSLFSLYLFSLPYIFSAVFLGIMISSFFRKREDAIVFLVLTSIPSLMLSGLSFPTESFPQLYQFLAKALPSTPGIQGFVKLTQMEASFAEVLAEWQHLWLLCLGYFAGAALSLKVRAKREFQRARQKAVHKAALKKV